MSKTASEALRAVLRWSLILQVVLVAAGVSVPARAVEDAAGWCSERRELDGGRGERRRPSGDEKERRRARESEGGERGHVSRRGDLVERSTHVEKKEGWRRID